MVVDCLISLHKLICCVQMLQYIYLSYYQRILGSVQFGVMLNSAAATHILVIHFGKHKDIFVGVCLGVYLVDTVK